jgi:drug/metabolite transporter (DMT)-like permease
VKMWILLIIGAVLEVAGDIFLKKQQLAAGLGIYFLGSCFWAWSLRETTLSKAIVLFTVLNLLLVVAVGVWHFQEVVTFKQWVGIGFALCAVILI